MNRILITICARGGSKGIPGKNIKTIGGRPLIAYTIDAARRWMERHPADLLLSTDSEEIRETARRLGLDSSYERPAHLADDRAGKPDAIKDAMLWAEREYVTRYDYVVDLDVTSPIRTTDDIEDCLRAVSDHPDTLTAFSVSKAARNPYFNMVEETREGYCKVVLGGRYKSRQEAPAVYDMNASIYAYRREALDREDPRAVTDRSRCVVMNHICFDLDEPWDFEFMDFLISSGKLKEYLR